MANPNPSNQFQTGNTVSADGRRWRQAINKAVSREVGSKRNRIMALDKLADTLVDAGLAGDIAAIKEIGNRLDGMAVQTVDTKHAGLTIVIQQGLADVSHDAVTIEHNDTQLVENKE